MNLFMINGVERPIPIAEGENFQKLVSYIHQTLANENSLVTAIKVNGVEINQTDEEALSDVQLASIESVEVIFSHPRELAEETLQTLYPFTERMIQLSQDLADRLEKNNDSKDFDRLLDGIETFTETITHVKRILRVGLLQPVNLLEADLLSVLKDLLEAQEKNDTAYRINLLREHLPQNLEEWIVDGIPALIRCRDS